MPLNFDISTDGLERVDPPAPRIGPPLDLQPAKSPFYQGPFPTTGTVNPDAVRNFTTPGIPSYRITPAQPLNIAGASVNTTAAATTSIAPRQPVPAPTIAQQLVTIPTGYQFSFYQVRLPLSETNAISTYKVYRSPGTVNSATVIQSIPHHPANVGVPVVVQDAQPNVVFFSYWVSAVSVQGVESTLVPASNTFIQCNAGFNNHSQLASSFHNNPVNVSCFPTSATTLSNNGGTTNISLAASTIQFGGGPVAYNSATIAPGTFGTNYIYAFDPQMNGGAVFYLQASVPVFQADDQVVAFGKIVTASGSSTTGGGNTGGTTPDGGAVRGIII